MRWPPYDPLFFEEPIRPENIEAWGDLKRGLACTLATGESLYSRSEFLRLLSVKGADIIQVPAPPPTRCDTRDRGRFRPAKQRRRTRQRDG
jgi:L-alanine-DL-glutamate epimerase-like enolase superfamily enzyme